MRRGGLRLFDELTSDLRYGVRSARRAPLFSCLAVVTLALGIGANAAVFVAVKSVLLDALPYADAERLVRVYSRNLDGSEERGDLSAGTISDIAERQRSFERIAAFTNYRSEAVYGGDPGPRIATFGWVEPGFFESLGVTVAQGRTFQDDDGTAALGAAPDLARVVVLTAGGWQRLLSGDPDVLRRDVSINGIPRTVIGVLPRDFVGPMGEVDFFYALDLDAASVHPFLGRNAYWLGLVGRLRPAVPLETAQRELTAIGADLAQEHPTENSTLGIAALPLHTAMVGDTRTPLLALMASAGFVLLIACANLAGALLSRALSRRKEFAVRAALGAGRGRLVRQLLTESTVLAVAGAAAGLLLAMFLLAILRGFAVPALPDYATLSLDRGAALAVALLGLVAGLVFGIAPALSVGRADPKGPLQDETDTASESRRARRLRGMLVAGQIALCISLLAGAGLLARSLWAMTTASRGFDPSGVLTVAVQLPLRNYPTPGSRTRFQEQFAERLRLVPGVDAVAHSTYVPGTWALPMGITLEGESPNEAQSFAGWLIVSDDYFRMLQIPLLHGRTFDAQDHAGAAGTIVISAGMARRYWPGREAVGARFRIGPDANSALLEVIGVVGDVRNDLTRWRWPLSSA